MRASRLSEFEADRSAARWGYAGQLAGSLETLPDPGVPGGIGGRLLASHPPLEERIERLRTADG
jgi:Zn-dependent protease with chaperone function